MSVMNGGWPRIGYVRTFPLCLAKVKLRGNSLNIRSVLPEMALRIGENVLLLPDEFFHGWRGLR